MPAFLAGAVSPFEGAFMRCEVSYDVNPIISTCFRTL